MSKNTVSPDPEAPLIALARIAIEAHDAAYTADVAGNKAHSKFITQLIARTSRLGRDDLSVKVFEDMNEILTHASEANAIAVVNHAVSTLKSTPEDRESAAYVLIKLVAQLVEKSAAAKSDDSIADAAQNAFAQLKILAGDSQQEIQKGLRKSMRDGAEKLKHLGQMGFPE